MTRHNAALYGAALALMTMTASGPARAQGRVVMPTMVSVSQGITTHGHGEIKVKPDIARLTAGVTTQDKYQDKAVQDNARKMTALIAAIKSLKIADKDIQTQGYSVSPQYDYSAGRSRLTGYQVTNSIQVTLRDLTQTGTLIDTVTQAGVNQGVSVDGVSYDLSDRAAAQDRVLTLAVADARRRAGTMADALGVTLGNPLSLNDGEAVSVQPLFVPQMKMARMASDVAPETPIATQEITVTADVTLVYALGPDK